MIQQFSQYQQQPIYMLTRGQSKHSLRTLMVLTILALLSASGGVIVMIINKYIGFQYSVNDFTCTSPQYFVIKYSTNNTYLSISFVATLFSCTLALVQFVLLLVLHTKLIKSNGEESQQFQQITKPDIGVWYISYSFCSLGIIIPLGYYASLIIEVSRKCNATLSLTWLLIAGFTAISLGVFIACLIYTYKMMAKFEGQEPIQEVKPEEQKIRYVTEMSIHKEKLSEIRNNQIEGGIQNNASQKKIPLLNKVIDQGANIIPNINKRQQVAPEVFRQSRRQSRFQVQKQTPPIQKTISATQTAQIEETVNPIQISQIKPVDPKGGQNVTTIHLNFPNPYPQQQKPPKSSSQKVKKNKQSNRNQVIKQSMEEELSSDSDDRYYKRARKTKRKYNYPYKVERDEDMYHRKQLPKSRSNHYSRFPNSPEPKYIIVSPKSIGRYYEFLDQQQDTIDQRRLSRNFSPPGKTKKSKEQKQQDVQAQYEKIPQLKPKQQIKSKLTLSPQNNTQVVLQPSSIPQIQPSLTIKPEVVVNNESQVMPFYQSRVIQAAKQHSIYHKLDEANDQQNYDDFKKYQKFFNTSKKIKKEQKNTNKPNNDTLSQYFEILNESGYRSRSRTKLHIQQVNYLSENNYSSILSQSKSGKIPQERHQKDKRKKIDLQSNLVNKPNDLKKSSKTPMIEKIRSKYAL